VRPEELMLVAAHPSDLRAARDVGLKTAYVVRPLEYGPNQRAPRFDDDEFDFTATDFPGLADQLGA
jgi:2-haloacid dehalogenase